MAIPSAQTLWTLPDEKLLDLIDTKILSREPRTVHFYAPSFLSYQTKYFPSIKGIFPTISITGKDCTLNCKHCEGKILQTMHPAPTPKQLLSLCSKLKQEGALGCLISGGCLPNGSVPLEPFIATLAKIKQKLGLTIFVHTGLIDNTIAGHLKNAGIDAVLIDVIGEDQTIHQTNNLNITTQNYRDSLKVLNDAKLDFIPHVIVGLNDGKLGGEFAALNMISQYSPSAIVIIAFMPILGTAMAKICPPTAIDITRTIAVSRVMFPKTPLALGCMRPKGKSRKETDLLSLKTGIDAIAHPTESAIQYAKNQNYPIAFSPLCCAHIYKDYPANSF